MSTAADSTRRKEKRTYELEIAGHHLVADVQVEITQEGAENKIRREIKLQGKLDEEQKAGLLAIAEKCPNQLFLSRGAKIETTLA